MKAAGIFAGLIMVLAGTVLTAPPVTAAGGSMGIAGSTMTLPIAFGSGDAAQINLDLPTVELSRGANGEAVFHSPGTRQLGLSGEPGLPWSVFTVLLPPDADLSTVACRLEAPGYIEVTGAWSVDPVPPMATCDTSGAERVIWPVGKRIVDGRDADIYQSGTFWPAEPVLLTGTGRLHGWKLAEIAVPLFRFNPGTDTLKQLESGRLVMNWDHEALSISPSTISLRGRERVRELTVNFEQAVRDYDAASSAQYTRQDGYAIITTSSIVSSSSVLDGFIAHKTSLGYDVMVVTEADYGGGQGDAAAENVRAWLQANYVADDIHYVLIIGNPIPATGDIPMKTCWTAVDNMFEMPTDYFYSDLSGDWDLNGDSFSGQMEDMGDGGIDRYWEVLVGRIPYYGVIGDMDAILQKTIAYELSTETVWRRNALLPEVPLDEYTQSWQLGEQIKTDLLEPVALPSHRLYADDYGIVPPPESTPCSYHTVSEAWDSTPFGVAIWVTHGWETGAAEVATIDTITTLNDDYPSATFQASCSNALPEATNNLAYSLLRHGAIATNGASRVGIYWVGQTDFTNTDSQAGLGYQYTARLAEGLSCGEAWCGTRQEMTPVLWMNHCTHNIYGDPSVVVIPPPPGVSVTPTDLFHVTRVRDEVPSISGRIYTLIDNDGSASSWSASSPADWLDVSPAGGTFDGSGTAEVIVSLSAAADELPPGEYEATLLFTASPGGFTIERNVYLRVDPRVMDFFLKFDETGGFVAADQSGHGNDGWLEGGLWFNNDAVAGYFDGALLFDGSGEYVDLGHNNLDENTPPWTVSLWVRRTLSSNGACTLFASGNAALQLEKWDDDDVAVFIPGDGVYSFKYTTPLDEWTHLVFIGDESSTSLWADTVHVGTVPVSLPAPIQSVGSPGGKLYAAIDDLRIFNHAVSESHVLGLFQGGPAENPQPVDGAGEVALDASLSWVPGTIAVSHDVYFGTDAGSVAAATPLWPEYKGRQSSATFDPALAAGLEYFWRVDEVRLFTVIPGEVWSFHTVGGETVNGALTCLPGSGVVPFTTAMTATLENLYSGAPRRLAGRLDVDLAGGQHYSNWRSGWSNIDPLSNFETSWYQNIPALGSVIGDNVFLLRAEDVTPAPYNQPPHPPAGGTDTSVCTVTGIAP